MPKVSKRQCNAEYRERDTIYYCLKSVGHPGPHKDDRGKWKAQMPKVIYVRKKGSDVYHWMKDCHFLAAWDRGPVRGYSVRVDITTKRPRTDLCNQCRSLEKQRKGKAGK